MGVYDSPYGNFTLFRIFDKGITIKQEQVSVLNYIDKLIGLINDGKVFLNDIITHTLPLEDAAHGYRIFDEEKEDYVSSSETVIKNFWGFIPQKNRHFQLVCQV